MTLDPDDYDFCPPPTDRLCTCRQCRAEWEQRNREMAQFLADALGIAPDQDAP